MVIDAMCMWDDGEVKELIEDYERKYALAKRRMDELLAINSSTIADLGAFADRARKLISIMGRGDENGDGQTIG